MAGGIRLQKKKKKKVSALGGRNTNTLQLSKGVQTASRAPALRVGESLLKRERRCFEGGTKGTDHLVWRRLSLREKALVSKRGGGGGGGWVGGGWGCY